MASRYTREEDYDADVLDAIDAYDPDEVKDDVNETETDAGDDLYGRYSEDFFPRQKQTDFAPDDEPEPEPRRRTVRRVARPKPEPEPQPQPRAKARVARETPRPAAPQPAPAREEKPPRERRPINLNINLTDRRIGIFFGILFILAAGYMLLVSISYYFNGAADQSIVSNPSAMDRVVSSSPGEARNAGGAFGAYLSDLLLNQWLGIGSFILIFYLAALGLSLVRVKRFKFWNLTSRCLALAIATSVVLGLVTAALVKEGIETHLFLGGYHGHELNIRLIELSGWAGAIGVSLLLLGLVFAIYFNDIRAAYHVWRRLMAERREAAEARRRQREAEEERLAAEQERKEKLRKEAEAKAEALRKASQAAAAPVEEDTFEVEEKTAAAPKKEEKEPELFEPVMNPDEIPVADEQPAGEPEKEPEFTVDVPEMEKAEVIEQPDGYDPTAELSHYRFPSVDLLIERSAKENNVDAEEQEENKERITKTLADYGIEISSIKATVGPTVTLYEIVPAEGVRIAKIKRLEDDIALSLAALGIRIIAPIPGKGTIGIEVPNKDPQVVSIRSIISSKKYQESKMELPMAMGCTISNEVYMADLCKMPHLLVAGATGMGKSVGLNTIIASLLYKKHPAELKFVLVDPKMVEFSLYSKLENHFLAKLPDEEDAVITNVDKAVATLNSLCVEMDNRYGLLKMAGVRAIKEYNEKFRRRVLNPEKGHRFLPYIVVIVDEFADLIMQVGKTVETPIARIAQKARAVGIHMILATQRPSTNVITGVIKANFPGRIAFRVFQMVDSRTILDRPGANQLIGKGDMLFSTGGQAERVQCAFIDTPEVDAICDSIAEQVGYPTPYELPEYVPEAGDDAGGSMSNLGDRDPLFEECARLVVTSGQASTSSLQRRYSIGYNRAGKIMDQMEMAGIVGPSQGGKPRQVLVDPIQLERILGIGGDLD